MKNGERQAFPVINPEYDGNWDKEPYKPGLTKREYFAGLAMQSFYSGRQHLKQGDKDLEQDAILFCKIADALLKQLEQ